MSNFPLGEDLKSLFDNVTSGKLDGPITRAILVQNDNGILRLVDSLPEEGTDKEDFNNVLGKLFAKEPSKPGYALYRLDSKSPAGLYEWLNCAYRPEGAKVREKMQYSITQASLFHGLNEQHFLETVYGGTSNEFSFPTRLRNQRKHDYQNPQLSTAGKKPAEAAGTGTLGRKNFDKIPSPSALPQRPTPSQEKPPAPLETPKTSSTAGVTQYFPPLAEDIPIEDTRPPTPPEVLTKQDPPPPTVLTESDRENRELGEIELAQGIAKGEGVEADAEKEIKDGSGRQEEMNDAASDERTLNSIQDSIRDPAPLSTIEQINEGRKEDQQSQKEDEIDIMQESIAPSSHPELTEKSVHQTSEASKNDSPPVYETASVKVADQSVKKAAPVDESEPIKAAVTSTIGLGTGDQGIETEKERNVAKLRSEEDKAKSGGAQGGSHLGFPWQEDVEPALRGLAKKLGGTSEWNLVILKLDIANEEIQLASQPKFVPPGDLNEALLSSEPCYAFYSHPDVQLQSEEDSQVSIIYVCPQNSSIRQRMLYSANLAITSNKVGIINGLSILKRIETSDPKELTAEFMTEELLGNQSADKKQVKAMSRPKRPGRR